jgi:hypothetical protein
MRRNKYGGYLNEEPAGNLDLSRRAGSKGAALCQQHCVGWDRNLKGDCSLLS